MNFPKIPAGISTKPMIRDGLIRWGPDGFFAIASENIVTIYQVINKEIKLFRTISRHKSNITKLAWNYPTVEINKPDNFKYFLAVADEQGNCLIYDVIKGKRHSGISPDTINTGIQILDITWSYSDASTFYVLTDNPAIICFSNGSTSRRRSSNIEDCQASNFAFKSFNLRMKWSSVLKNHYMFISQDPFDDKNLILGAPDAHYMLFSLNEQYLPKQVNQFGLFPISPINFVEFFPHYPNRVIIGNNNSVDLFDLETKELIQIFSNSLEEICVINNMFSAQTPNLFWGSTISGSIIRFELIDDIFVQTRSVQLPGNRLFSLDVNRYDPNLILAYSPNGKISVIRDDGNSLTVESALNDLGDAISCWCLFEDGFIYATTNGSIIYNKNCEIMKFEIKDKKISYINLVDNKIILAGNYLTYINLNNRNIMIDYRYQNPQKVSVSSNYVFVSPISNVIDILEDGKMKHNCIFSDSVKYFVANSTNKKQVAVFINNSSVYIIDASKEEIEQIKINFTDAFGDITSAAFVGDKIVAVSNRGMLYYITVSSQTSRTVQFNDNSLKLVRLNENYAIVVDVNNTASLIELENLRIVSFARFNVIDADFMGENFACIQTSNYSFRFVRIPQWETFISDSAYEYESLRDKFIKCEDPEELEKIAIRVGDLKFVNLARTMKRKHNIPLSSLYSIPHESFMKRFASSSALSKNSKVLNDEFVDYLILTKQFEKAAGELLKRGTERDALLAHACLSPNLDAARLIASVQNLSKLSGRLLVIAGDREGSLMTLESNSHPEAIIFAKMLYDDDECTKFLEDFVCMSTPISEIEQICAFMGDSKSLLPSLAANQRISSGRLCLLYLGESGRGSLGEKLRFSAFGLAKKHVEVEWDRFSKIIPIDDD